MGAQPRRGAVPHGEWGQGIPEGWPWHPPGVLSCIYALCTQSSFGETQYVHRCVYVLCTQSSFVETVCTLLSISIVYSNFFVDTQHVYSCVCIVYTNSFADTHYIHSCVYILCPQSCFVYPYSIHSCIHRCCPPWGGGAWADSISPLDNVTPIVKSVPVNQGGVLSPLGQSLKCRIRLVLSIISSPKWLVRAHARTILATRTSWPHTHELLQLKSGQVGKCLISLPCPHSLGHSHASVTSSAPVVLCSPPPNPLPPLKPVVNKLSRSKEF